MNAPNHSNTDKPTWIVEMEATFGGPSQNAFGTAVFFDPLAEPNFPSLEERALHWYQFFCGKSWEKLGADPWLNNWKAIEIPKLSTSILQQLKDLEDPQARMSGEMLFDGHDNPTAAKLALTNAFDHPEMKSRQVFRIGDGDAMSGIIITGRRSSGETVHLAFLMD